MNNSVYLAFAFAVAFTTAPALSAEPALQAPAPLISQPGALLFADEFTALKPVWGYGKGDWKVEDGNVRGAERAEDHHKAGLAHNVKFRDGLIRFVFKFDGAKAIEVALIKTEDKERIHVGRISFNSDSIKLYAQTGMGPTTTNKVIAETPVKFVVGKSNTALIELIGNELVVQLDTGEVARARHELFAAEKTQVTVSIAGSTGVFEDLKLWSATRKP